jgi:hypothetical protein
MSKQRTTFSALVAGAAVMALMTTAVPAAAVESDPLIESVRVLDEHGLMSTAAGGEGSGVVAPETGVTVSTQAGTVSLRPDAGSIGEMAAGGAAVVYDGGADHSFAVTGSGAAADAGYVVIDGDAAPDAFAFSLVADGRPALLELTDAGGVLVKNAAGEVVNVLGPAWALDANGGAVPTRYELGARGELIQRVDHKDAAYPVVADPRLLCDLLFCTMMYSKSETQHVAAYSGAAGSLLTTGCSILAGAIGGLVCGFAAGYAGGVAQQALNQGKCVGMRAMIYVPQPTTHLVIEKC